MTMQAKTLIGIIAIIVWVAAVIGKHFWPDLDTAQLVEGAQAALVGIGVFHITSGSTNTPNSVLEQATVAQSAPVVTILPPGQAGRSLPLYPLVTLILAIIVTLAMGGCAGLNVQWAATATYNTPASTTATMTPGAATAVKAATSVALPGAAK